MRNIEHWLLLIGTLAYVGAFILTLARVLNRRAPLHGTNLLIIFAGWLVQTSGMWLLGLEAGSCPIRNPYEVMQYISWSIIVVYLFTGQVFRLSLFGTGSASLAAIIGSIAFFLPNATHIGMHTPLGGDPRIEAHAALALFSYGIFGLLAVLSALYLLQHFSLKSKKYAGVFRFLPSIMDMDVVLLRLLIMACVIFTISISIGALYWVQYMEQVSTPKLITTIGLWSAYWLVLVLRSANKLFGTRLAWVCILMLVAALLTLWPVEASRYYGVAPMDQLEQQDLGEPTPAP